MPWTMRPATADDHDQIRNLFREVFGYQRADEHDRWLSFENPDGQSIATVAEDRAQIVGCYTLLPTMLRLGKQNVLGAQSLDTMTHPDYRGQGMFTKLAIQTFELAGERGVKALYGYPNEASYPGFVRRLNWDHTGDIPRWTRVLKPSVLRTIPRPIGWSLDAAASLLVPKGDEGAFEGPPPPSKLAQLITKCFDQPDICRVARSVEWMNWRFSPASGRRYEWVTAEMDGELAAVAVWGIREDGHGVLTEIMGMDQPAVNIAVARAVRAAYRVGVPALHTVTNEPVAIRALKRARFFTRKPLPLIVRSMTHENLGGNIHNHSAWRVVAADIDTY
ncbi:MAG TPA: GNAT family N-acetyltransferase [Actinobacteria bacterium]|nr:GNAT family N-acetyltransferase [Actinomycetota bacterium]